MGAVLIDSYVAVWEATSLETFGAFVAAKIALATSAVVN